MSTVVVAPSSELSSILKYLALKIKNPFLRRHLVEVSSYEFETILVIDEKYFTFDFKDHTLNFEVSINEYEYKKNDVYFDKYREIKITGVNLEIISEFIAEAVQYIQENLDEKSNNLIYIPTYCGWKKNSNMITKKMNNMYIPEKILQGIINDVQFYENEDTKKRYSELDINHSRVYMLYGPPGTGKTTLIRAIATHFNKNIAQLMISQDLDDSSLTGLLGKLPKNCIVCIEDIDSLFTEDRKSTKTISFSGVLNILDGNLSVKNSLIFITTNHLDRMDYALKRRINYFVEFGFAVKEQIKKMYQNFFPCGDFETFYNEIKNVKMTTNILEKFFIKHLFDDINDHIDELIEFAYGEIKVEKDLSMYC